MKNNTQTELKCKKCGNNVFQCVSVSTGQIDCRCSECGEKLSIGEMPQ